MLITWYCDWRLKFFTFAWQKFSQNNHSPKLDIILNLSHFISKRIRDTRSATFTATVIKIAIGSIAMGLAVMIVSFAILEGFRNTIQSKIFSFGAHIQVTRYNFSSAYEESPVSLQTHIYQEANQVRGVAHIQQYSLKPALLKTENEVQGVVLKGVATDFNLPVFEQNMLEGRFINWADTAVEEMVISKILARQLNLKLDDQVWLYFLQNPPRFRNLKVVGIYETGLEEYDERMILGDIKLIQDLNDWSDSLAGGFEVFVEDFAQLDQTAERVYDAMDYDLTVEKITDRQPQLFDWLTLLTRNVKIFLVLILVVACFNMISTLLIMIMERTNMIGLFKALGATNWQIRKIFIYNGVRLILYGMLIGNALGLGFCAIQYYFRPLPLDQENYYMSYVPIYWDWGIIVLLNVLTLITTSLVLIVPTLLITRIKPISAIKFD
jgi:lipoprotein-releasing system permease protein